MDTSELTLFPALFENYTNALYWKVDFNVSKVNTLNQISTGMASLILKKNLLPQGGSCSVDIYNGTSLSTYFTIQCINWIDLDGVVQNYEYFGKKIFLLDYTACG